MSHRGSAVLGQLFGNDHSHLWKMENGYLFPTGAGLEQVTTKLQLADADEVDKYRSSLRIGLQWN